MKKIMIIAMSILAVNTMADLEWNVGAFGNGVLNPDTGSGITDGSLAQLLTISQQGDDIFTVVPVATAFSSTLATTPGVFSGFSISDDLSVGETYFIRVFNGPTVADSTWYGDSTQVAGTGDSSGVPVSGVGQFQYTATTPGQSWNTGAFQLNQVIPEPSSVALFGLGLLGLARRMRRS